jgi:hypothetical protein
VRREAILRLAIIKIGPVMSMPQRQAGTHASGEDFQFFIGPRHGPRRVKSSFFDGFGLEIPLALFDRFQHRLWHVLISPTRNPMRSTTDNERRPPGRLPVNMAEPRGVSRKTVTSPKMPKHHRTTSHAATPI